LALLEVNKIEICLAFLDSSCCKRRRLSRRCGCVAQFFARACFFAGADVYCDYEAGSQDETGAATQDTAATDKRHGKVEVKLAQRTPEEMLLTHLPRFFRVVVSYFVIAAGHLFCGEAYMGTRSPI